MYSSVDDEMKGQSDFEMELNEMVGKFINLCAVRGRL